MGCHWVNGAVRGVLVVMMLALWLAAAGPAYAGGDHTGGVDDSDLSGDGTLSGMLLVVGVLALASGIWMRKLRRMLP